MTRRKLQLLYRILFSKKLANKRYKQFFGENINWNQPYNLDEKINWLKFYSDTHRWSMFADKYEVRKYVEQIGLKHLLIPLYGAWNSVKEVPWQSLPNDSILKMNNGSGDSHIIHDAKSISIDQLINHFSPLFNRTYGIDMAELHYKYIKPKLICEQLLPETTGLSTSIVDYKVWFVNGKPVCVFVVYNRTKTKAKMELYDLSWNNISHYLVNQTDIEIGEGIIPKPESLDVMINAGRRLCENTAQARVDFYDVAGKAYFGEITMTSSAGYHTYFSKDFRECIGKQIVLPKRKLIRNW